MAYEDWPSDSETVCSTAGLESVVAISTSVVLEARLGAEEVLGGRASVGTAVVSAMFCRRGEAAARDRVWGFGLSFGFEKDGLGSSLGAGEGNTLAGVL